MTTILRPAIDKHIPMPNRASPANMGVELRVSAKLDRKVIYPFADMDVTDSFFVPFGGRTSATVCAHRVTKARGWRFSVRNWMEKNEAGDNVVGIRVWRVI